jgi:hypothetical protein
MRHSDNWLQIGIGLLTVGGVAAAYGYKEVLIVAILLTIALEYVHVRE